MFAEAIRAEVDGNSFYTMAAKTTEDPKGREVSNSSPATLNRARDTNSDQEHEPEPTPHASMRSPFWSDSPRVPKAHTSCSIPWSLCCDPYPPPPPDNALRNTAMGMRLIEAATMVSR